MAAFPASVTVLLYLYLLLIWHWFAGIFLNLKGEHNGKDNEILIFFPYFNPILKKKKKILRCVSHKYFELIFWSNTSRVSQEIYQSL